MFIQDMVHSPWAFLLQSDVKDRHVFSPIPRTISQTCCMFENYGRFDFELQQTLSVDTVKSWDPTCLFVNIKLQDNPWN